MAEPFFSMISKPGLRGRLSEELYDSWDDRVVENPGSFLRDVDDRVIKDTRLRWAGVLTLSKGQRIFFKKDRTKGWFESLKYLFLPSKARREWLVAREAQKKGLRIPEPLGWIERVRWGLVRESCYISRVIDCGIPLESVRGGTASLVPEVARSVKKFHRSGLFHRDLHAGNLLWDGHRIFLIDLHAARIAGPLSLRRRLWNICLLFHSLRSVWTQEDQLRFMEAYFDDETSHLFRIQEYLGRIRRWMNRLQKRQWRSRTKRCVKESTEFSMATLNGMVCRQRRDLGPDLLTSVVREHERVVRQAPSALVKNSRTVTVSIIESEGRRICVKEFSSFGLLGRVKDMFRPAKAMRAWVAGNGLRVRGVPALQPLAMVQIGSGLFRRRDLFLMEALESGEELDRYLVRGFDHVNRKRIFIGLFARWLADLHGKRIYHRDMKTCNIWVSEEGDGWAYRLLDLEDVVLDTTVDKKKLFRGFLQLNSSIPKTITRTDRLRFLRNYLSLRSISLDRKAFVKQIADATRKRGTLYVAPWGVVEENRPSDQEKGNV
jgi:tRNA A-37 threonylcarbamoyl transferase component Bud32